jgi:hypothetical protein
VLAMTRTVFFAAQICDFVLWSPVRFFLLITFFCATCLADFDSKSSVCSVRSRISLNFLC